ncbi:MAG: thiamine-phosphate kinase [Cyclonatronaceae bacterium]
MSHQPFTPIQEVGRQQLIDSLRQFETAKSPSLIKGIGDDAAVFRISDYLSGLLSTDSLVEGVHFDLVYTPFKHLGFKAVTAAVSDIYAMNGKPELITVSVMLPNRISLEMLHEFYSGVHSAAHHYNVDIAGGDVAPTVSNMVLSLTAYGTTDADRVCYRSGAKPGEALCVTGDLGGAFAGLKLLMREKNVWQERGDEQFEPDLSGFDYVVGRQLVPHARKDLIDALQEAGITPGAMIDISQGLANELIYLGRASGCGARIYEAALPVAPDTRAAANELQDNVDQFALHGGEDYELMFTLSEKDVERFADLFRDFVVIGKLVPASEGILLQTSEGDVHEIRLPG